jgi:hypothetical protein
VGGVAAFNDLGAGNSYGEVTVYGERPFYGPMAEVNIALTAAAMCSELRRPVLSLGIRLQRGVIKSSFDAESLSSRYLRCDAPNGESRNRHRLSRVARC